MSTCIYTGLSATDATDWKDPDNWDIGVPGDGDDAFIGPGFEILDGLSQYSDYVILNSLNIALSDTKIGTDAQPLEVYCNYLNVGYPVGGSVSGSTRIHIATLDNPCEIKIWGSSSNSETTGYQPVRITAHSPTTNYYIYGGKVGIADQAGETSAFNSLTISGGEVVVGHVGNDDAVDVVTVTAAGGTVLLHCPGTTVNADGASVRTEGDNAWTTANVRGGTFVSSATGLLGTLNMYGGVTDFTRNLQARTVTTPTIYRGATLQVDRNIVTFTNKLALGSDEAQGITVN